MNMSWLLFAVGTLAGLVYWGLGMAASSHFEDKTIGDSDRFFSTGMLWSLAVGSYEAQGQKLCAMGNIALVIAAASWIGWAVFR
jgi:hypothetical protein